MKIKYTIHISPPLGGFPVLLEDRETSESRPWPPAAVLREPAVLVTRLRSTAGQQASYWEAGDKARLALNAAPYHPVVRAVVGGFRWYPPSTRDCPAPAVEPLRYGDAWSAPLIRQGGSSVLNWSAVVIHRIPDPVRARMRNLAGPAQDAEPWVQGSLHAWPIPDQPQLARFLRWGSGNTWLYNHLAYNHRGSVSRVMYGELFTVVVAGANTCVLSPDHPDQPISLGAGWWLLTHPLPRMDGGGD